MPTNTFDRKLEISDPESVKRLIAVMEDKAPTKVLSDHPYTQQEREKSKSLLSQCLARSIDVRERKQI